jgi:hypothetical protein
LERQLVAEGVSAGMSGRQIIFVLGMGRSGTSLLARVLSLCGAALPDKLLGPDEGNPAGYWEPLAALEINEAFLARFGSSWYDPTLRLQGEVSIGDSVRETYVRQIQDFLQSCPAAPLLVIKEPRITALTEFWFEATRRTCCTPKIVIPIRHPDEVGASLAARDGVSPELSSLLWLKYNLLAERHSRPFHRAFINYSNLVKDWRGEITRVACALALPLSYERDEAAVDRFITVGLHRQRAVGSPVDSLGRVWTSQVYAALSAAARDEFLDAQLLDRIFCALSSSQHAFPAPEDEFRERFGPQRYPPL